MFLHVCCQWLLMSTHAAGHEILHITFIYMHIRINVNKQWASRSSWKKNKKNKTNWRRKKKKTINFSVSADNISKFFFVYLFMSFDSVATNSANEVLKIIRIIWILIHSVFLEESMRFHFGIMLANGERFKLSRMPASWRFSDEPPGLPFASFLVVNRFL